MPVDITLDHLYSDISTFKEASINTIAARLASVAASLGKTGEYEILF